MSGGTALTIRDAVPADLDALVALSRKTFSDKFAHLYDPKELAAYLETAHAPGWYLDMIRSDEALLRVVETEGGRLGAYLLCSPLSLPAEAPLPGAVELKRVYVDGPLQGHGLGSRLVDEALDWARRSGAPEMYLSVYADNLDAQRLYARLGWRKVGEFIFHVGRHQDREFLLCRDMQADSI